MERPKHVNLRGMLRVDEMEDLLSNMLDRLQDQDLMIKELQNQLNNSLPKSKANETFEILYEEIERLKSRMNSVELASTVIVGVNGESAPASEIVSSHMRDINRLQSNVNDCSTRNEVEEHFNTFSNKMDIELLNLKNQTASLSMATRLQQAQQDSTNRLSSIESLVALKLDKSDIGHIESLAENLSRFENFRVDTIDKVKDLTNYRDAHNSQLINHNDLIKQQRNEINNLTDDVTNHRAKLSEHRTLAKAVQDINDTLQTEYARNDDLNHTNNVVNYLKTQQNETDLFNQSVANHMNIMNEAMIKTIATKDELNNCVLRKHFEQVCTALGSDLDSRASLHHLGAIEERTRHLESRTESADEQLGVAVRFVDWFTQRGEHYEHNMKLIDRHLGSLAKAQDPKSRDPYKGQVKFTPITPTPSYPYSSNSSNSSVNGSHINDIKNNLVGADLLAESIGIDTSNRNSAYTSGSTGTEADVQSLLREAHTLINR